MPSVTRSLSDPTDGPASGGERALPSRNASVPAQSTGIARIALFVILAAPVAISLLTYFHWISDGFVLDDFIWLKAVSSHRLNTVIVREFTFPSPSPFEEPTPFWRPAAGLLFYFEHIAFGFNPDGYHAINFVLHGVVGGLTGLLVLRLTRSVLAGLLVSVLFVVWPSYDFAVTWISELSELMGAVFISSALVLHHMFLVGETRGRARLYSGLAAVSLGLGLLSKESSIIGFPLLLSLTAVTPPSELRRSGREIRAALLALAVLSVSYGTFAFAHEYLSRDAGSYGFGWHVLANSWDYLQRMSLPYVGDMRGAQHARQIAALTFLILGGVMIAARRRVPAFFFIWTLLAVLPFSGFQWTEWRYTYLPTLPFIGFVGTACVTGARLVPARVRMAVSLVAIVSVTAVALLAAQQSRAQQSWIHGQSVAYSDMISAVRQQCGSLQPGAFIYVVGSDVFDLYGVSSRSALNIVYHHVHVSLAAPPPLADLIRNKCVVRMTDARR